MIPKGSPAWVRTATHDHYDGNIAKANYLSQGVIDPLTDVGAEGFSRAMSDLAAAVRTAPFCQAVLVCSDSVPAAPTFQRVEMQTGVRATSYLGSAAPTGFPSAARNGNGDVTLTFASSYADEFGIAGSFELQCPEGSPISFQGQVVVEKLTATTVRLRAFDTGGVAVSNPTFRFSCTSGF